MNRQASKGILNLCRERGTGKPPFILVTGRGGQKLEKERIAESSVDAVIEKPVDLSRLGEVIREVVGRT
jgi:DNA-binding response OmpR family regulator